jgi:hypothetical protein
MNNASQHVPSFRANWLSQVLPVIGTVALLCTTVAFLTQAGVSTAPLLVADNFDTGNTTGAPPADWEITAPGGTSARVVDATVKAPSSPPYCVELIDNSPSGRAEMSRSFLPSGAGKASAAFRMDAASTAHAAMQLRTATGANLCSVIFAGNGHMRYQQQGGSTDSTMPWTTGRWQQAQIEWFDDLTFSASLGDTQFVKRAHFVTNGVPGRIYIIIGYGRATNRIGYVDDVKVVGPEQH